MQLTLADFDYAVPEHLVAQEPLAARDASRLLVRAAEGALHDAYVRDLTSELPRDALLILNDTRVFPSRLLGQLASGGKCELFLLGETTPGVWQALGRPMKKLKPGTRLAWDGGVEAEVREKRDETDGSAVLTVAFNRAADELAAWLDTYGVVPLPPYIKREAPEPAATSRDRDRYQTVYARATGSVAAPTAGLHFTPALLAGLAAKGIATARVCLHVGGGTFLPVKSERLDEHVMHREKVHVPKETAQAISDAKRAGRPVIAVGTTTFRALEDLFRRAGRNPEKFVTHAGTWNETDLFVRPATRDDRYVPWVMDALITNFHQPKSTLFMLVCALLGYENARSMYAHAIAREYRLFSYGDACLLWLGRGT